MEQPFYGRTGLLETERDGLPIVRPRLLSTHTLSAKAPDAALAPRPSLKWYPSLLTVPQQLLHHLVDSNQTVDGSLAEYLRVALIVEVLRKRWKLDRRGSSALLRGVFDWHAHRVERCPSSSASPSPPTLDFYLPAYKLLILKEQQNVGSFAGAARRSVTLLGKDHHVNDLFLDHPSCSAQHAALQVQFVNAMEADLDQAVEDSLQSSPASYPTLLQLTQTPSLVVTSPATITPELCALCEVLWQLQLDLEAMQEEEGEGGETGPGGTCGGGFLSLWSMELQLVDLGSTNGTKVNGVAVAPEVPVTLIDGDVLTFGASTRSYVLMRATDER